MENRVAPGSRLERSFFSRSTLDVAYDLIGCLLVSELGSGSTIGRIVEAEAYLGPADPASHAARLRTERVASMSGLPGIAYVYRSYGIHAMLNVVAKPEGMTGAILIRAAEPIAGIELMQRRRDLTEVELLCSGPGRLCQAFGITLDEHGTDLAGSDRLWLAPGSPPAGISTSGRIGISRGTEHQWRYYETGSRFVSGRRAAVPMPR